MIRVPWPVKYGLLHCAGKDEPGHGSRATDHEARVRDHVASALLAAEAACGVLAHFHFLVKELDALLAELLAVTMLELADLAIEWRFVFHGGSPPGTD